MRRIAYLGLLLALNGCGYKTWWNPPLTGGFSPNMPQGEWENLKRVRGIDQAVEPITTEPGDIWPGPLPPPQTLKDLEISGAATGAQAPTPGSPLNRTSPNPSAGSSTPPGSNQPGLPSTQVAPPLSSYAAPPAAPPRPSEGGRVIQTPGGPAVTTGGTPGYQTTIQPGGGQSIVVPNGNGTSTIIHGDGRIETVPTPK